MWDLALEFSKILKSKFWIKFCFHQIRPNLKMSLLICGKCCLQSWYNLEPVSSENKLSMEQDIVWLYDRMLDLYN